MKNLTKYLKVISVEDLLMLEDSQKNKKILEILFLKITVELRKTGGHPTLKISLEGSMIILVTKKGEMASMITYVNKSNTIHIWRTPNSIILSLNDKNYFETLINLIKNYRKPING